MLLLIRQAAARLARYGFLLRSGGAIGADSAFEAGCDEASGAKEIFLPWEGFNDRVSPYYSPPLAAEAIAAALHPHWKACSHVARRLHSRNIQQVYGAKLDDPVDFVLFWAREVEGRVEGGTATAVQLARKLEIPTFNLYFEPTARAFAALR